MPADESKMQIFNKKKSVKCLNRMKYFTTGAFQFHHWALCVLNKFCINGKHHPHNMLLSVTALA